jgi:hypothetical protein
MNSKALAFSLLLVAAHAARASVIGDLAASVPEHTFVKMPVNPSLSSIGMESSLLYYADSGVWDPLDQEIAYVGGPGTCCADPAIYKRISYSVANNTWSIANAPFTGSGHGYDANALDPRTGAHYFAYFDDKVVHKWNGKAWDALPPHTLATECCVSLSWFPDLNKGNGGLLLQVGSGLAAWFDGTAWNNIPKPSAVWGEYEGFSEYNPVLKSVWLGGGSGAENSSFLLDANLKYTHLKDAPVSLTTNNSLKSVDPVSGKYIVYSMDNSTFWEFDAQKDVWTKLTPPSMPNLGTESLFQVPIPQMGVILFFKLDGNTRNVYLYRHTPGQGVTAIRTPVRTEAPRILASADPSGSLMTLSVSSALSGSLTIHDSQGRLAASWPQVSSYPISWDVSRARGGVYLARFQGQGTTSIQRIVVPR